MYEFMKKPSPMILMSISIVKSTVCTRSIEPYTFDSIELGSFKGLSSASMTEEVKMRSRMMLSNHCFGVQENMEGQHLYRQRQHPLLSFLAWLKDCEVSLPRLRPFLERRV